MKSRMRENCKSGSVRVGDTILRLRAQKRSPSTRPLREFWKGFWPFWKLPGTSLIYNTMLSNQATCNRTGNAGLANYSAGFGQGSVELLRERGEKMGGGNGLNR